MAPVEWRERVAATADRRRPAKGVRFSKAVVIVTYLAFALLWVSLSDWLVHSFEDHEHHARVWQFGKAMAFCLLSAALMWWLMSWYGRRLSLARREIEAGERLRLLGEVSATIAHEFKNILMGARLSVEVAARRIEPGTPQAQAMESVRTAFGRLQTFSQNVLRFTKPATGALETLDLTQWADRLAAELSGQLRSAALIVHRPDRPVTIAADAALLHQAVLNLILNARDAGAATIELGVVRRGQRVLISVADDGGGIPVEIRDRLFAPLTTTKAAGTGLGLSLVYSVVAEHGGEIEVRSTIGSGTTFTLDLPALAG
jgi:signal transduction histidine kinase